MAVTESQKNASKKYHQKLDDIKVRVPKGEREIMSAHAAEQGESLNAFIRRAIAEAMQRDKNK